MTLEAGFALLALKFPLYKYTRADFALPTTARWFPLARTTAWQQPGQAVTTRQLFAGLWRARLRCRSLRVASRGNLQSRPLRRKQGPLALPVVAIPQLRCSIPASAGRSEERLLRRWVWSAVSSGTRGRPAGDSSLWNSIYYSYIALVVKPFAL